MRRLLALVLSRPRRRRPPAPDDPDRLLRVYRETAAEVERLRRAA